MSLKRLPFLANSDFHKPKHIYSWKTLLHCPKQPEAIKECIRRTEDISITLYRGAEPGEAATQTGSIPLQFPGRERSPALELFEAQVPAQEPLVLAPARSIKVH